jgi:hypothetical protein
VYDHAQRVRRLPQACPFPFADKDYELERVIKGRCKNVPTEIIDLMQTFKPYRSGNDLLWALSKLSVVNRHQRLLALGASTDLMYIHQMTARGVRPVLEPLWDSVKNELVFARADPDVEVKYDVEFSFYIAFGDVEVMRAQPVIPTLDELGRMVASIIHEIEAETARLLGQSTR